jgi:hypothetical protein
MPYPGGSRVTITPKSYPISTVYPPSTAQPSCGQEEPAVQTLSAPAFAPEIIEQWMYAKDMTDVKKTVIFIGGIVISLLLIDIAMHAKMRR